MRTIQQLLRTPSCVDAPQRRGQALAAASAVWAGDGSGSGGGGGGRRLQGRMQGGREQQRRRGGRRRRRSGTEGAAEHDDDDDSDGDLFPAGAATAAAFSGRDRMGSWAMTHMRRYNVMSSTSLPAGGGRGGAAGDDGVGVHSEARLWQVTRGAWERDALFGRRLMFRSCYR